MTSQAPTTPAPSPALWFSRHTPTHTQIEEALGLGYQILAVAEGMTLGAVGLNDELGACVVFDALVSAAKRHEAVAVFGVFPTPLLARCYANYPRPYTVPVFAAWNITRSAGGGPPTFCHHQWQQVARLAVAPGGTLVSVARASLAGAVRPRQAGTMIAP